MCFRNDLCCLLERIDLLSSVSSVETKSCSAVFRGPWIHFDTTAQPQTARMTQNRGTLYCRLAPPAWFHPRLDPASFHWPARFRWGCSKFPHVHRPTTLPIKKCRRSPSFQFFSLLFFILTLIECREIMNTWYYGGEPALHIVVLAVMNCPSGPFRSEFLISTCCH